MRITHRLGLLLAGLALLAPTALADDTWVPKGWTATKPAGWDVPEPKDLADEQVLTFNNGAEPKTLDPAIMTGVPEHTLAMAMFEGLTIPHPKTLEPMPGQAEAWAVSPDGTTWRFLIRKNALWSNGDPVTAHDFIWSWKRVLEPKTAAEYSYQLYPVKNARAYNAGKLKDWSQVGLKAIHDHLLEVQLESSTPYFLQLTYFDTLFPVHRKTVEAAAAKGVAWTTPELVCNGPFTLKEWSPRSRIVFAHNPRYWNASRVKLKEVIALPIDDQNTSMNKYLSEEIDWARSVPATRIDEAKKNPDYFVQPYLGSYYYSFNTAKKPFDDVRVRRAFSLAIDRMSICRDVLKGGQIPAYGYVPPGIHGYEAIQKGALDAKTARKLLAEAGFPGGKGFPTVELLYNTLETHKVIAEAIVEQWRQILGVNVKLRNTEWKVYLSQVTGQQYQVARRAWIGDYGDPNTFLDMFVTDGGNNRTGWSNKRYDALIEGAARESDKAKRMALFREAERLLLEEAPIAPIYYYVNQGFLSPLVGGWMENNRDLHPFQFIYMKDE